MMRQKTVLWLALRILLCAVLIFLLFWFTLPPLNPRSPSFWIFLITSVVICLAVNAFSYLLDLFRGVNVKNGKRISFPGASASAAAVKAPAKVLKIAAISIGMVILLMIAASVIGAPLFNASSYKDLITMTDGDFSKDVPRTDIDMNRVPVVDRDTAVQLGKRKLGEMSDLVSQFEIEGDYTQINYKGTPVRVTPLAYGDPIKWLNNHQEGIPAYIKVDMVSQQAELIRLSEGIRYAPSEYFMRNINRYLRFQYPTKIFDSVSFEIDEEGTPYWIAPTVSYRIGLWSGRDIGGAVLVNAITGESRYCSMEEIPAWVDQVYVSDIVIEQLNYNGKYRSGFFNSIFGQTGVLQTTEGYNYIAVGDDVYLYTGMTSVLSDESNVGFVLVNLRTKETRFYTVPGAEEYSAMDSAEGQVQNLKYTATFPILLNMRDRPTYFMSLKDGAGLVKMYAFVDVERYQVVGTGATVKEAEEAFRQKLQGEDVDIPQEERQTKEGTIRAMATAVVNGNTTYYLRLEGDEATYIAPIALTEEMPFLVEGDRVRIDYIPGETAHTVVSLMRLPAPENTQA